MIYVKKNVSAAQEKSKKEARLFKAYVNKIRQKHFK